MLKRTGGPSITNIFCRFTPDESYSMFPCTFLPTFMLLIGESGNVPHTTQMLSPPSLGDFFSDQFCLILKVFPPLF